MYRNNEFITAVDLSFSGILYDVKKSKTALQPVYEAFTNALEAIKMRQKSGDATKGKIHIRIDANKTTLGITEFDAIAITDNGIGFNDDEFKRFNTYKLSYKGYKNLGSGRIQFVHHFDTTTVNSTYKKDDKFFERQFVVSKKKTFLDNNAIVNHIPSKESSKTENDTTITFRHILEKSGIYDDLNNETLKTRLLERYAHYFCNHKNDLPEIKIEFYVASHLAGESTISAVDIPDADKIKTVQLLYSKKAGNAIEKTENPEDFTIHSFALPAALIKENKLNLVSKGEVVEDSPVVLESLAEHDTIRGNKYIFLVSSDYIDSRDSELA